MAARRARPAARTGSPHWRVKQLCRERPGRSGKYDRLCAYAAEPRLGRGKESPIDYRFAAGDPTLFKTYAAELVGLSPDAILATGVPAVAAIQQQTRTIPIVFMFAYDPVGLGFVQSLARPGGNITGFSSWDPPLMGKWLQLFKEIAPGVTRVTGMINPDSILPPSLSREIDSAARSLGMTVTLASVHDDAGIEEAVATLAREPGGGLMVLPGVLNNARRGVIAAAAVRYGIPSIAWHTLSRAGVLLSYWFDQSKLPEGRHPTSTASSGAPIRPTSRCSGRRNIR